MIIENSLIKSIRSNDDMMLNSKLCSTRYENLLRLNLKILLRCFHQRSGLDSGETDLIK